jgi:hypothetical protein
MFGSTVLEVGIGMALLFLFASLIATAAQEFLEGILQKRGKDLEKGIRELLNDPEAEGDLTSSFYNHPRIASLYAGTYRAGSRRLPSYIPSESFAITLLDLILRSHPEPKRPDWQKQSEAERYWVAAQAFPNDKVRGMVLSALDVAQGDITLARKTLQAAFDATMDRVSGWYRHRAQWVLAAIGFFIAASLNIDALTVAQRLFTDDTLRKSIVASAAPVAGSPIPGGKSVEQLSRDLEKIGYPIGWQGNWPRPQREILECRSSAPTCLPVLGPVSVQGTPGISLWSALNLLLGWMITSLAIMLGAPFWFDVLNKFMVIRSTVKPNEKSKPEASEDRQSDQVGTVRVQLVKI